MYNLMCCFDDSEFFICVIVAMICRFDFAMVQCVKMIWESFSCPQAAKVSRLVRPKRRRTSEGTSRLRAVPKSEQVEG